MTCHPERSSVPAKAGRNAVEEPVLSLPKESQRFRAISPVHARDPSTDTVSKVIHKRRRKAPAKPSLSPAPLVNNFAADFDLAVDNLPAPAHPGGGNASVVARSSS